jgi:hypothetical protein
MAPTVTEFDPVYCGSEPAREGGLTVGLVDRVHIHFCGNGSWRFRPYGGSLFFKRQKK